MVCMVVLKVVPMVCMPHPPRGTGGRVCLVCLVGRAWRRRGRRVEAQAQAQAQVQVQVQVQVLVEGSGLLVLPFRLTESTSSNERRSPAADRSSATPSLSGSPAACMQTDDRSALSKT